MRTRRHVVRAWCKPDGQMCYPRLLPLKTDFFYRFKVEPITDISWETIVASLFSVRLPA